jgi:hypothetical protein
MLFLLYAVRFFPKNPGTMCAEIYEKEQGKKFAKSLFLTCCLEGLISAHTPNPSTVFTSRREIIL